MSHTKKPCYNRPMTKVFKAFLVLTVVLMAFSSCKKKLVQADESKNGTEKSAANGYSGKRPATRLLPVSSTTGTVTG